MEGVARRIAKDNFTITQTNNNKNMKTKEGFAMRNVCGESIIIPEGLGNIDFTKIISMNESSAYLWEKVKDTDFTAETLADLLTQEYDIDYDTALNDSKNILQRWLSAGIIEE